MASFADSGDLGIAHIHCAASPSSLTEIEYFKFACDVVPSDKLGMTRNADGSYDVYFGPEAPEGHENNWVQTISGKGWNTIVRLYGSLEPWYNKIWRPGEIELVK